jgi:hypothetical protein
LHIPFVQSLSKDEQNGRMLASSWFDGLATNGFFRTVRGVIMRIITAVVAVLALTAGSAAARESDAIVALLDPYFRIQTHLVADSTDGLKDDAGAVAKAAQELGDDGKPIVSAAETLAQASSLASARIAFGQLSDAVIAYADRTKNAGTGVEKMYCPMVKKSWLQKGDTVRNPYLGKAMPDCGEKKKIG